MPYLFRASGEDLRPGFGSDFQRVDFGPSSGNESSSELWITLVADKRLVRLLGCDLMGLPYSSKLLTYDFDR